MLARGWHAWPFPSTANRLSRAIGETHRQYAVFMSPASERWATGEVAP